MEREKQIIEEMARDICPFAQAYETCEKCDTDLDIGEEPCTYKSMANFLIQKGYRKVEQGEWKKGDMPTYGGYKCSVCGENTIVYKAKYCPHCGACMKGE